MKAIAAFLVFTGLAGPACAQEAQTWPRHLPSPGGEVIIPSPSGQYAHDQVGYAPARRVGDLLYVSGGIVARAEGEGNDVEAFEVQTRRTLANLNQTLQAAGATMDDVAMINSFHVWEGPDFAGSRREQIEVISRVWGEFSFGPRPAWTAVGTTGLLATRGIVEIQLIVHAPRETD